MRTALLKEMVEKKGCWLSLLHIKSHSCVMLTREQEPSSNIDALAVIFFRLPSLEIAFFHKIDLMT